MIRQLRHDHQIMQQKHRKGKLRCEVSENAFKEYEEDKEALEGGLTGEELALLTESKLEKMLEETQRTSLEENTIVWVTQGEQEDEEEKAKRMEKKVKEMRRRYGIIRIGDVVRKRNEPEAGEGEVIGIRIEGEVWEPRGVRKKYIVQFKFGRVGSPLYTSKILCTRPVRSLAPPL